jgi:ATP/maltotriose-dependent transcriptional regulator MalT
VSALVGLTTSVLDGIASLVDSGMVQLREEQGREPLLYIFEAIREFGVELLEAHGEMERSRDAHAAYYLTLSEQAEIALFSATQSAWLERLEQEFKNIRAALQWLLAGREAIPVLRIASALGQFWFLRGHLSEGRRFIAQALEVSSEGNEGIADLLRAKALAVAGFLALRQYDPRPAIAYLEESLALCRPLEDKPGMAASLLWLGTVEFVLGGGEAGVAKVEESLSLFREMGATGNCADVLLALGTGALSRGEYDQARKLLEESLALFQAADVTYVKAMDLHYLGLTSYAQGQYTNARQFSEESLELFRMLGVPFFASEVMTILAYELAALGEQARARSLLEEALIIARERENTEDLVRVLCGVGHLALLQDNLTEARSYFEEGIAKMQGRWLNPRIKWAVASCLEGLAAIALTQEGHAKWTVRLFAAAETVRAANGYYSPFGIEQPFYEQTLAGARSQLSEKAFALAWAAGQAMTPQQAVAREEQPLPLEEVSLIPPAMAQPTPAPAIPGGLTEREVEVLRLAAMGMSNKQIADQLVLSPNTVNAHIQSIYRKIDVSSRSSATRFAIEHQLI